MEPCAARVHKHSRFVAWRQKSINLRAVPRRPASRRPFQVGSLLTFTQRGRVRQKAGAFCPRGWCTAARRRDCDTFSLAGRSFHPRGIRVLVAVLARRAATGERRRCLAPHAGEAAARKARSRIPALIGKSIMCVPLHSVCCCLCRCLHCKDAHFDLTAFCL